MIDIGVDIGGTFTDVVLLRDHSELHHTKVPSTPGDPIGGVRHGIEKILAAARAEPSQVTRFVHGSTVAINALLERKGAITGVLMTKGFEDTLEIGRQKRSRMYELMLEPETPTFLAPRHRRFGIVERIAADGSVVEPLSEEGVRAAVRLMTARYGVTAIAVCFLFSFRNPAHEERTRQIIAEEFPGVHVSLSSVVDPTFREYERVVVTTLDAYLQGGIGDYVERLSTALRNMGINARFQVMQSRGGISGAASVAHRPISLLLSGLAAGVIGGRFVAEAAGHSECITIDIGGTSCDIALVTAGKPILTNQTQAAGFPLRAQMIDVNTIGAGGGSIAWLDDVGGLRVGPQSAGATPGPACYAQGGQNATVTDASVVLGYLNPENFADGELTLDRAAAIAAIDRIAGRLGLGLMETAAGIHRIVNAKMADEVRRVSIQRGYDPRLFSLLALGGAGPVHAGAIALELGIPRVIVPATPGVLSAFGLLVADIEHDQAETFAVEADAIALADFHRVLQRLTGRGLEKMRNDGVAQKQTDLHEFADMRYVGQSYELTVEFSSNVPDPVGHAVAAFHTQHQRRYGHSDDKAAVEFVNLRTVLIHVLPRPHIASMTAGSAQQLARRRVYFSAARAFVETPVYLRIALDASREIRGPALIEQADTTVVVYPGQTGRMGPNGSIILEGESHGN